MLRYPDQEAIDQALAYLETAEGQQTLSQRQQRAEWVMAEAKSFHGLPRALQPGLEKFKIQALLIASVQNLKRLVAARAQQLRIFLLRLAISLVFGNRLRLV